VAATCACALFAGSAQASEIVGSTLTQDPNMGFVAPLTVVAEGQPAENPAPNPLSPTSAGVITSVRIKHAGTSASPGSAGLRILGTDFTVSFTDRNLTASSPVEASNFAWPASLPAGIFTFIPTAGGAGVVPKGIPIATDQRLGYAQITGPLPNIAQYHGFDGHNWFTLITDPFVNHASGSANYRTVFDSEEVLIQYTVEPDADLDGYGDDTQDACPADIATRVDCAAAIPALTGTDPASPADDNAPRVQGTAFNGSSVALYENDTCTGTPLAAGTATELAGAGITFAVADDTTKTVYASMTIPSGTSDCSAGVTYEEVTPPDAPDVTGVTPATGADDNHPQVTGSADPGTTVDLYATDDCSGAPAASGDETDFSSTGIAVTVADNSTTTFRATATDEDGTTGCSTTSVTYAEVTPPPAPPATPPSTSTPTPKPKKCKKGKRHQAATNTAAKKGKCVKKKRKGKKRR
jgi:hypothetical protein